MGRSIIVGDVHGCSAELRTLLDRVGWARDDQVVFVGDVVARGPDSRGVLEVVREIGARSVVGNHEHKLLEAYAAKQAGEPPVRLGRSQQQVMDALEPADWDLLQHFPLYLDLPEHDLRVLHAGVVPGIPITEQDPKLLVSMRGIDGSGKPTKGLGGSPWGVFYQGPPHIAFGHNAVASLQLHAHATGLDTGCVYGGSLTALVLPEGQAPPPVDARRDALVSVAAAREYYPIRQGGRSG